jgi:hypothetical protein
MLYALSNCPRERPVLRRATSPNACRKIIGSGDMKSRYLLTRLNPPIDEIYFGTFTHIDTLAGYFCLFEKLF